MLVARLAQYRVTQLLEVRADLDDRVEVAHPHLLDRAEPLEERVVADDVEIGPPPFTPAVNHPATVVLGDFLVAETQSEDWGVEVVDGLVVVLVLPERRQAGAAGDDDALVAREGLDRILRLPDFGEHVQAADLRGDEVGVLPPEVNNGNGVVCHGRSRSYHRRPT